MRWLTWPVRFLRCLRLSWQLMRMADALPEGGTLSITQTLPEEWQHEPVTTHDGKRLYLN